MAIHCNECGFDNPPGMRFCGNCGTRLSAPGEQAASTPAQTPAAVLPTTKDLGLLIGADLLERFQKAGLEARGQRRNVTVLFADLSGFTSLSTRIDSEVLYSVIRRYLQVLAQDVYKYEGMVDKFTGDGLMALFGAPIAHENNAELGVLAGLDMLADMERLNQEIVREIGAPLRVRIGLNAGVVTVGGIGSDMLFNYTAIGDTVNLAQRLESVAETDSLLVSQSVYDATQRLFEFSTLSGLTLKGFGEGITAYQLLKPKAKPGNVRGIEGLRAPMIGRETEYQHLLTALRQVEGSSTEKSAGGHFALISGEAGIGKSRLVSELTSAARQKGFLILAGHSLTYRRSVPYWIFQDMLRLTLNTTASTPPLETRQRLHASLNEITGTAAQGILPYLEHLLTLPPSDPRQSARIDLLDSSQLRQQIFLAVRSWLHALAERQPLLVILEDLHWADDTTLDLISFLLASISEHPIFYISISRPLEEGSSLSKMAAWAANNLKDHYTRLELHTLSLQETQELFDRLMKIRNLSDSLRQRIIQQSSGIPFYLEEIIRMLMEQGVLVRQGDEWVMVENSELQSLDVPNSLQGLILARFDRTAPDQRRLLQTAAAIGRQFNLGVLRLVLADVRQDDLQRLLDALTERDFIYREEDPVTPAFAFRHVIVSDAIYSTLLRRDRADLHGKIGLAMETVFHDQLENLVEILARHFSWSNNKEKAMVYLAQAGQKAARAYNTEQARAYLEEALELLLHVGHTPDQAIQLNSGLGNVLLLIGEYEGARLRFERALEVIGSSSVKTGVGNYPQLSNLNRSIAVTYERQGEYESAFSFLSKAVDVLKDQDVPVEKALALNDMGWIRFRQGQHEIAQELLLQAMNLAEKTPRYDVTASIYNRLGGVYWQQGDLAKASEFVQKSLALREEIGDVAALARSYNNLGLLNWMTGKWESALSNFDRCLDLNANLGDIEGAITAHGNLGLLRLGRGEIEQARHHFEEALNRAQQIGHSYNIANSYLNFSQAYLMLGEWQMAYDYALLSLKLYTELDAREDVIILYSLLGGASLGLGNMEQAEKWANQGNQLVGADDAQAGETDAVGRLRRLWGEIYLARELPDKAEESLKKSRAIFARLDNELEEGRTIVALAVLSAVRGDYTRARVLSNEARLIFRQLGARADLNKVEAMRF